MATMEIARFGEGDFFGEMSLILGDARTATVIALGHCECIRVPKKALLPVLMSHGQVGTKLASAVLKRRKDTDIDLSQMSNKISRRFDLEGIMQLLSSVPIFEELAQQVPPLPSASPQPACHAVDSRFEFLGPISLSTS